MKHLEELETMELLMIRDWIDRWTNTNRIPAAYVRHAINCANYVDKELWKRIVNIETPWGRWNYISEEFEEKESDNNKK